MTMREARVRRKQPAFIEIAETFYGSAFGPTGPKELARSIADWAEMTPEEQTFALGHLQWLQLQAQAELWRQLGRACRLLEEVAEAVDDVEPGDDRPNEEADLEPVAVEPPAPSAEVQLADGGAS